MTAPSRSPGTLASTLLAILGIVELALGGILAVLGFRLIGLGGSWYYGIAGVLLALCGLLVLRRHRASLAVFAVFMFGTVIWAFAEAGLAYWPLVPRLGLPLVLTFFMALAAPVLYAGSQKVRTGARGLAWLTAIIFVVLVGFAFQPHGVIHPTQDQLAAHAAGATDGPEATDWQAYGQSPTGIRHSPLDQITPDNVKNLKVAWTFRTGDVPKFPLGDQATPIQVGDTVFTCTPTSQVFAIDADTGEQRWHYNPKAVVPPTHPRCRGVEYFDADKAQMLVARDAAAPGAAPAAGAPAPMADNTCRQRILLTTMDARLQALDATTGELCKGFGDQGTVLLRAHQGGKDGPGWYTPTSAPTVVGNLVIVGGWVSDGIDRGAEPSGVVRAFNAETGALVWAWDAGNPDTHGLPEPGKTYTLDSPNMWSHASFDAKLGLVFLPVGGTIPDYYGVGRSEAIEKRSTSVVAVDAATGHERWVFQTVHHDLWDYDVSPQPALYDVPDGKGGTIPAVIQATKLGQIFVLDRRTGKPITEVKETPVPQTTVPGETPSPTQPVSVGMPRIGGGVLAETDMWGLSLVDQLMCRIDFKKLHYEGNYTPALTQKTLHYPGVLGGMNWAGVSVDPGSDYLIVNDIRIGQVVQMLPRPQAEKFKASKKGASPEGLDYMDAYNTPYGINREQFFSPLGVPCQAPPFGTLTAIDLKTKKIAWQRPLGTVEETGPFNIRTGLPVPIGMPTLGASITTKSGLVFYAGTLDFYLRAFNVRTGEEIWKSALPVGAQATPMTYRSPKTGRQYVVISAGGSSNSPKTGDYVIAYALPDAPR